MGDLSLHFSRSEFACPCGCGFDDIDLRLIPIEEAIRAFEGNHSRRPSSACRCFEYNELVQKKADQNYMSLSSKSKHMAGTAVDEKSQNPVALYTFLDNLFPGTYGIGLYNWGIHIDTRHKMVRWDYRV